MRVLCVHNYYRSRFKGGEDAVFDREVKKLKTVLGEENVLCYTAHNDNLKAWKLPFSIWSNRTHAKAIYTICKQKNIDLVHVHNFFPLLTASAFKAAKQAGAKVVHTLHNYRWWCLSGTLFYKQEVCEQCVLKKLPWPGIIRKCYRQSFFQSVLAGLAFWFYKKNALQAIDAFWVLSSHQKNKVETFWPNKKIFLKPNAIQIPQTVESAKSGFIFVGRLEPGKGIEELLQVWSELDDSFQLTVIGGGELEEKLRKQYAQPNIHFLGIQPFEVVSQKLVEAKYCLHTSLYYETFGLVMLEAMARGTPVIGFPIGTRLDIIINGVNGFLVVPQDLKAFLNELKNDNYNQMSHRARETACAFSEARVTAQQIALYRELIDAA